MLSGSTGSWSRSTKPSYSDCWMRYMILERLSAGYGMGDISALKMRGVQGRAASCASSKR